jgi:hypothetical protein
VGQPGGLVLDDVVRRTPNREPSPGAAADLVAGLRGDDDPDLLDPRLAIASMP